MARVRKVIWRAVRSAKLQKFVYPKSTISKAPGFRLPRMRGQKARSWAWASCSNHTRIGSASPDQAARSYGRPGGRTSTSRSKPSRRTKGIQSRTIRDHHLRVTALRPSYFWRHGPVACRPTLMQLGQDRFQHAPEQIGGQTVQPLRHGLRCQLTGCLPQQALLLHRAHQFADTADLAPNHAQYQRHHDRGKVSVRSRKPNSQK